MNETKFTPGPWSVRVDMYEFHDVVSDTAVIACTAGGRGMTKEEYQANAYLIAAAPELYDALEMAEDQLMNIAESGEWPQKFDGLLSEIHAALCKARGEDTDPPSPADLDNEDDPELVSA